MVASGTAATALKLVKKGGAEDAVAIVQSLDWYMVRFANNGVIASKAMNDTQLSVFAIMGGKASTLSTTNLSRQSVENLVTKLMKIVRLSPPGEQRAPLPKGPFRYSRKLRSVGDPKIDQAKLPDVVRTSMESALSAGASRVAGAVTAEKETRTILTTAGAEATFTASIYDLNVRAFADSEATGQFANATNSISKLDAESVGRHAGEIAKKSLNQEQAEAGKYDVVLGPMISANLIERVAFASSAFSVLAGSSFLTDKLGQKIASPSLCLEDDPTNSEAPGAAMFDDEGLPTLGKAIIEKGTLKSYLHNSNTARKMNTVSTANAGLVGPRPFTLVVGAGTKSLDELVAMVDHGLYVTNNWYHRYQNMRSGDFSTIIRDGAFRIEGGQIAGPVRGLRLSDNMLRILGNIDGLGRERSWIKWWEVTIPTLTPSMLVRGANFTKPTL